MTKILLTTAYMPPIPYFSEIKKSSGVVIEQYEHFGKQSYRNRCEILTANGVISLSVPVEKANSKTLTKDLKIVWQTDWQRLHFKGIESAYRNSPYYDYYIDDLRPLMEKKEKYLLDLNTRLLHTVMELIHLDRAVEFTEDYVPEGMSEWPDLRGSIHPKPSRVTERREFSFRPYHQTFGDRFPFVPGLSILDLLFNAGPETSGYL